MFYILGAIPVLICLGLVAVALYYWKYDAVFRKRSKHEYYDHPDKDMPLYNRGHCDRYSAGNFFW